MDNQKYTLVINYPALGAGGIETYLVSMMRYFLRQGHRVIWITTTKHKQRVPYKGLVEDPGLEIFVWEKWSRLLGIPRISFQKDERVIMITCRAMQYVLGEVLRRRAGVCEFRHYYVVAHHSGEAYFPDRCMKTAWGKSIMYAHWQKVIQRLVANNRLMAFAEVQLENYEEYYQVLIPDKEEKVLTSFDLGPTQFDEENTSNREQERKDRFVITTCARFEFPHKGYILGLVDSYCNLKKKYPQVILQIIGGGADEAMLYEKIAALPDELQRDIVLTGIVSPDDLDDYYKNSHVIVGLAGAILLGAQSGIPSIVVRHFCNICEAYGFFEDASDDTLSDVEGEEITPLLERCINMSREEYLQHGREGFRTEMEERYETSDFFFTQCVSENIVEQTWSERIMGRFLYLIVELKNHFGG